MKGHINNGYIVLNRSEAFGETKKNKCLNINSVKYPVGIDSCEKSN